MRPLHCVTVEHDACCQSEKYQPGGQGRVAKKVPLWEKDEEKQYQTNKHQAIEGSLDHYAAYDTTPTHSRSSAKKVGSVDLTGPRWQNIVRHVPDQDRYRYLPKRERHLV